MSAKAKAVKRAMGKAKVSMKAKVKAKPKLKTIAKGKSKTKARAKASPRKKAKVSPIPKGYRSITPYLIIKGAAAAIDFYKKVFAAKVHMQMDAPNGAIGHAEITIGDSKIMLADEFPEMNARSPQSIGGSPVGICLYVKDVDTIFNRAVAAGASVEKPLANMFYGDRMGTIIDPFGHKWSIGTHIEDVSPKEMQKRMAAMQK